MLKSDPDTPGSSAPVSQRSTPRQYNRSCQYAAPAMHEVSVHDTTMTATYDILVEKHLHHALNRIPNMHQFKEL